MFRLVRAEASKWRLLEKVESRRWSRARKTTPGGKTGAEPSTQQKSRSSTETLSCWTCGASGLESHACPSAGKGAPGAGLAPSGGGPGKSAARQQVPHKCDPGAAPGKGTPPLGGAFSPNLFLPPVRPLVVALLCLLPRAHTGAAPPSVGSRPNLFLRVRRLPVAAVKGLLLLVLAL